MSINNWVQKGHISIWEYKKPGFEGFHMDFDFAGFHSLLELFSLIKMSDIGAYRTIKLTYPEKKIWDAIKPGSGIRAISKLRLEYSEIEDDLILEGDKLLLKICNKTLIEMEKTMIDTEGGHELSFDIGDQFITFWW